MTTLSDLKKRKLNTVLYCEECGAEYSSDPADYFLYPDHHEFTCCDHPLRLVKKRVEYDF